MKHTVEYIHHFTCEKCLGWWSIASLNENYRPKKCGALCVAHRQEKDVLIDVKTET